MVVKIDKGSALAGLSLTPMIDIVFLLLIFFLVATRFAKEERELDILLPNASAAQPLTSKPREIVVNIDRQGRYFVTGEYIDLKQLEEVLEMARVNNPGRASVIIRAHRDVRWNVVAAAANSCSKAKIRDVKFTTNDGNG